MIFKSLPSSLFINQNVISASLFADDLQSFERMINRQVSCCCVSLSDVFSDMTTKRRKTILIVRRRITWSCVFFFRWAQANTCFESLMNGFVSLLRRTIAQTVPMTSASCCCCCFGYVNKIKWWKMCSPRSTILPKRFLPRRKLRVEQFHRRFRNWCWHSVMAMLAPFAIAASTPGFSRASRRCFRLSVAWMAGSMYTWTGVTGEMLFGSPAFAIPLQ